MSQASLAEHPTVPIKSSLPAEECPDGHPIKGIGIFCQEDGCRRFILFAPEVYQSRVVYTYVSACLLIPSCLAAILLSRFTDQVWPLYLFFMFGVILVYGTIFSRGRELRVAAAILAGTVLIWLAFEVATRISGLAFTVPKAVALAGPPTVGLAFAAVMVYFGRRRTFAAIQKSSTYFLTTGALTFAYWGCWLTYLENNVITLRVYELAVAVGLILPLGSVALLAAQTTKLKTETSLSQRKMHELLDPLANGLVVAAGYVILIEPLIQALAFILGRFLPQAVGHRALPDITLTWLGGPGWRALLTSILLAIAITLVAVRSAIEETAAAADERSSSSLNRTASAQKRNPDILEVVEEAAEGKFRETRFAATIYGRIGLRFLQNLLKTIRHFIRVAVPVTMFSAVSISMVLILGVFQNYRAHGPFFASVSLWGTGFVAWILVVVACGLAFWSAREHNPAEWRLVLSLVETGSSSFLGGLLYFLLSMVSLALLPLWLYPQGSRETFNGFVPGEIYFTNLLLSMGALVALIILTLAFGLWPVRRRTDGQTGTEEERKASKRPLVGSLLSAAVLLALVGTAVYNAWRPLQVAVDYAATQHADPDENAVRALVPVTLSAGCVHDQMLLTGYDAGLTCPTSLAGTEVSYHMFDSNAQLDHWYAASLASRGIPAATGDCASAEIAEGLYTRAGVQGRLACKSDRTGSWLLWTDPQERLLVITRSTQSNSSELYAMWKAGTL